MLKPYIAKAIKGIHLSYTEAEEAMAIVMRGDATQAQIGGYLVALRMKGETVAEIAGSAAAMRSVVNLVEAPAEDGLIDTAGTGGDGSHSFNISTAAAFVIAGAGRRVAKHGNRAASSRCGSADVLAALGVEINLTPEQAGACIRDVGIGFMFAPRFHPAMKHAIGPRVELGQRTIFNILGPLTNPAGATHQLLGVFDPALTEPMASVLGELGGRAALVVHGAGGLDELSTSGPNRVSRLADGRVESYALDPADFGLRPASADDLIGGEPALNAELMRALLDGRIDSPLVDVVVLNAGAALSLVEGDLGAGIERARESLASGAAAGKLDALVEYTREFAG